MTKPDDEDELLDLDDDEDDEEWQAIETTTRQVTYTAQYWEKLIQGMAVRRKLTQAEVREDLLASSPDEAARKFAITPRMLAGFKSHIRSEAGRAAPC